MWEAYTLRNFWGIFWHQTLRWPLTSLSKFVTQGILNLKHPSLLERYANVMVVFLTSGFLHLTTDYMQGVSPSQSGAIRFFSGFTLAFMIEDGVQEIWRKLGSPSNQKSASSRAIVNQVLPLWQRVVGFLWVMAWLSLTSPEYLLAYQDLPKATRWYVPIGMVNCIGIGPASIITMISGVFVYFALGAVV
ncbi:hypothetical protein FE257_011097 [Aspergillus nanangensis]|uniref:Wax synthase domain-containing protein n=1 Tax=Aspergillus nanangensis TaxID=2582783 RepID=A0AAD4GRM9_ASPNN|nr:hypothetical protein FE257_011097 [Aspergillus nanangensis]